MGDVQNENAENDARDSGNPMRAAEKEHIKRIEPIPDAAPDHNKTDSNAHIIS